MRNKIIPYNPKLKEYARKLRKEGTLAEVLLWNSIRRKAINNFEFHRQVPILNYIVDFYCHKLMLAIEIDGRTHDYKFEYDTLRTKNLEKFGIVVIRYSEIEVRNNLNEVLESIINKVSELTSL